MTERNALVAACRAAPDDDLPRLVLADWYEENGHAERAVVVRAACEEAKLRHTHSAGQPGGCRKCKLWRKVARWIEGAGKTIFREMFSFPWEQTGIWYGGDGLHFDQASYSVRFDRGLVTEVWSPLGVWLGRSGSSAHGQRITAEHPVSLFTPTDLPDPLEITGGPHVGYWFWTLRDLPEEIHPHIPHNKVFTDPVVNRDEARRVMSRAFLAWAKSVALPTNQPAAR